MIVAFIGSDDFKRTVPITVKMMNVITKLVTDEGADVFLFTNEGVFDEYCWQIVNKLKTRHRNIMRVFVETGFEDNIEEPPVLELFYDKIISLKSLCQDKMLAPYARNRFMIGMSDVLVTYLDVLNLKTPRIASITEEAIKFAKRYKKRIINLVENSYSTPTILL